MLETTDTPREGASEMPNWITEYWHQLVMAVVVVIWLARLDGRIRANESEIRHLMKIREEDLKAAKDARDATNEMLLEIRTDIKNLISQVSQKAP